MLPVLCCLAVAEPLVEARDVTCPSPSAVAQRLVQIVPEGAARPGRRALLTRQGPLLRVEALDGDRVVTSREITASAPCQDLAAAAAVIIATAWEAGSGRASPVEVAPIDLRPPRTAAPPPASSRRRFDLSASLAAAFSGPMVAPAGSVTVALGGRLASRLSLSGTGPRQIALGTGEVGYSRVWVGLGPRYLFSRWRLHLEAHAEGALGAVITSGSGYAANFTSADLDVGLCSGARIGLTTVSLVPFIGALLCGWLRPQVLEVLGGPLEATLPRVDVLIGGGLWLGRFP